MGDMHGAIFCDPNFVDNFFTVDSTKLQTVLDSCKEKLDAFYFEEDITREGQLYNPICEVLNIIKQTVGSLPDSDTLSPFVDVSAESIPSDRSNTAEVKPDLALFEGSIRHWETMRMPIEIKRQATYLKTGMKKLTWYARMIFAHQMHRRHVYGLAICKWDATFVRFDRCGVLYSKPIDMRSQEFRKAFAGLMMLDEVAFGYDTAFTTKIGQDGRLEYYVDLPAEAFASEGDSDVPEGSPTDITGPTDAPNPPQIQTRRLKVVERLCHREGIRGRATVVVRLRKVIRPGHPDKPKEARQIKKRTRAAQEQQSTGEILGTRDYVLKMMWRDPEQKVEGEALQRLVGIYGIGQHMWHIDVLKPCSPLRCKSTAVEPCEGCLDMTASRDQVLVTTNMTDLDIEIPEEKEGEGTEYKAIQTDEYLAAHVDHTPRIYSRLLTSTVGLPLSSAESPRQLLQAVLDAILGYWRLVNMGVLHRDISDGNVLMLRQGQGYNKRDWRIPRATTNILDPKLAESESLLQEVLDRLDRDPTGMLNDFDMFTTYGEMGAAFYSSYENDESRAKEPELKRRKANCGTVATAPSASNKENGATTEPITDRAAEVEDTTGQVMDYRVGTPAFMSARVLEVEPGQRYKHCFMDDLESFFWLLLVCVIEHVDSPGDQPTESAKRLMRGFHRRINSIYLTKSSFLIKCDRQAKMMRRDLALCENSWAADPAIESVVVQLGAYFNDVRYEGDSLEGFSPGAVFPMIVEIFTIALAS